MKVTTLSKYTILLAKTDFTTFFDEVSQTLSKYKNQNIILDFSNISTTESDIKTLKNIAETQAKNKQSFVIILSNFNADAFDEELNVVPTLTEAEDIIDMDEMSRDLGF